MRTATTTGSAKREWHGTHHSWSYRPEAFRWAGERIAGVNLLPIAGELRAWMMQRGPLSLMPAATPPEEGGFTNPYAASGVTLQLIMGRIINDCYEYTTASTLDGNEVDAEVQRVRQYDELLICSARFCEAAIKQLLYCTQIPKPRYGRMALGSLLESPCPTCKAEGGMKPHRVSMVGTLAHPFQLCMAFEQCAMDHMDLVNRLRNTEAAHAGVQPLNVRTIAASKGQLKSDSDDALGGFVHMLSHLEDLERAMIVDLSQKARAIDILKRGGLAAADCNFDLVPGEPFVVKLVTEASSSALTQK